MAPLAYSDLGAKYAFFVVLAMFGASEWSIRLRSRMNHGGTRLDRGSIVVVIVTAVLGVAAAFALAAGVQSAGIRTARLAGLSHRPRRHHSRMALRRWAVLALGQFFTVQVQVRSGQTVVDTGPYRFVRHPSYTAIIMSFVGIGVALENWLSLVVIIVVPTIGLIIRIRVEERALLNALGEPYREFSQSRARIIPKVW